MKLTISVLVLFALTCTALNAQTTPTLIHPSSTFDDSQGYITINELTAGIGLSAVNAPYAHKYFGFTTIHGYQTSQRVIIALGTGVLFYDGGKLLPLFADFRYMFLNNTRLAPYLIGDGGVLLKISGEATNSKLFINPGAGIRYDLSSNFAANFGIGLFVQKDNNMRSSFINFRLGVTLKPVRK